MVQPEERPKKHVSWKEIDTALEGVKDAVRERYNSLFGIPRGGLVVTLLLSYKTDLPMVYYEKEIKEGTLVVDDIVDQGATLRSFFLRCPTFGPNERYPDVFALYSRTEEFTLVFPAKDAGDEWLIFPWEDEESSKNDGTSL